MTTLHDDELILFHYRDGLAPGRMAEIASALAASPDLARRYRALERLLAAVDQDVPPAPDAQFEQRLWQRLQPRLGMADAAPAREDSAPRRGAPAPASVPVRAPRGAAWPATARAGSRRPRRRRRLRALAVGAGLAATLVLAFVLQMGLPFGLQRERAGPAPSVVAEPAAPARAVPAAIVAPDARHAADRILVAQLSQHLRRTQGALQSVARTDGAALLPMDDAYLRALALDNRLYAVAAERRGIRALAGFLRSLDPVLLELAHRSATDVAHDDAMRGFVRDSDLLFRIRAAHARLLVRSDPHA